MSLFYPALALCSKCGINPAVTKGGTCQDCIRKAASLPRAIIQVVHVELSERKTAGVLTRISLAMLTIALAPVFVYVVLPFLQRYLSH